MRRMQLCPILSPNPLSGSTYTEQSSHTVRVGEEASVCGMIPCVSMASCVSRHGFKLLSHLSPPSLLQEGKMVFDFFHGLFHPPLP